MLHYRIMWYVLTISKCMSSFSQTVGNPLLKHVVLFSVSDGPTTEPPPPQCALPEEPNIRNQLEQGTRFGLEEDSRFEYDTIAGIPTDYRKEMRLKWVDFYVTHIHWLISLFCFRFLKLAKCIIVCLFCMRIVLWWWCSLFPSQIFMYSMLTVNGKEWQG